MKQKFLLLMMMALPLIGICAATWSGPSVITTADWNNPANWSPAGVPTPSEKVIFTTAVTLAESTIPISASNAVDISGTGSVTIASGVSLTFGDVRIMGTASSLVNNGTLSANNLSYVAVSGSTGTVTNTGTMSLKNLNVGDGANSGAFNNSGALTVTMNIVVEEGTLANTSAGTITTYGLTIRSGGTVSNSGTFNSVGTSNTAQITIEDGGTFNNNSGATLNSNINNANVYAIYVSGAFNNHGTVNVGIFPPSSYNAGSKGILVASSGDFVNTGSTVFNIDPSNCVIVDNHGLSGSYANSGLATIYSGSNCNNLILAFGIINFSGNLTSGTAELNWQMSTEENLAGIQVQFSTTGLTFTDAKYFQADGRANYSHSQPQKTAVAYYRLKLIYRDGKVQYSSIIALKQGRLGGDMEISLTPNRISVGQTVGVQINSLSYAGKATIVFYDGLGRAVQKLETVVRKGVNTFYSNGTNLVAGIYVAGISFDGGEATKTAKFVVQ